jgi:hypothetical protein
MPTQQYDISPADGWVQIAASGVDFTVEMQGAGTAQITLQSAAPVANAPSHSLTGREVLFRPGTGNAYASAPNGRVSLVVSS